MAVRGHLDRLGIPYRYVDLEYSPDRSPPWSRRPTGPFPRCSARPNRAFVTEPAFYRLPVNVEELDGQYKITAPIPGFNSDEVRPGPDQPRLRPL